MKEDVSAETVTLIRDDMKLRISFEGQPTALRTFSTLLVKPLPTPPPPPSASSHAARVYSSGKSERDKAGRTVGDDDGDGGDLKEEDDDEEGPIGHPVRERGKEGK